jgi:hypothetical protein
MRRDRGTLFHEKGWVIFPPSLSRALDLLDGSIDEITSPYLSGLLLQDHARVWTDLPVGVLCVWKVSKIEFA